MKKYIKPIIEIEEFNSTDVITTSGYTNSTDHEVPGDSYLS